MTDYLIPKLPVINFYTYQRKYISNRQSYAFIRRTSDRLCKEHGLSVVKPGKDKGKTYAEWDAQKKGKS